MLTTPAVPGSVIMPGETVARIAAGGYYLRLALPERHAAHVKAGDPVTVGGRGQGPEARQRRRAAPANRQGLSRARGRPRHRGRRGGWPRRLLRRRTRARVDHGRRAPGPAGAAAAVQTRNGVDYVASPGTAARWTFPSSWPRWRRGGRKVEVLSGLRAGDRVVTP